MIDLDGLAADYIDGLAIPASPPVEAVRARGRQRRTRTLTALATAATVVLGVVGIGTFLALNGGSQSISAASEAVGGHVLDMDRELSVLDDWVVDEIPLVVTPSLPGWTTETVNMDVQIPGDDNGQHVHFVLRRGEERLSIQTVRGEVELASSDRTSMVLDRPDGSKPAFVSERSDETTLSWNERPGALSGPSVIVRGANLDGVVAAASDLALDERPLEGSTTPRTQPLDDDRSILLQGVTSGTAWQITRSDAALPILEVNGIAPEITSGLDGLPTSGPDLAVTSISFDRRQINMVRIPNDAVADLVDPEQNRIPLPTVAVEGTTYSIAVAPIPAGKHASTVIVSYADGAETDIWLPWIPTNGWSNAFIKLTTIED